MRKLLEAKLEFGIGLVAPDVYDEAHGLVPPDDFVVTRKRDGSTASLYDELVWDYSAYTPNGSIKRLYFSYWENEPETPVRIARSKEMRAVVFCLIWRRNGAPMSVGAIANYISVLSAAAQYAEDKNTSLAVMLGSTGLVLDFVQTRASGWMGENLGSLLACLARIGNAHLGFKLVGSKCIKQVKGHNKDYRSKMKQHPPIPTRIYSQLLIELQRELTSWLVVANEMLQLFRECVVDSRDGLAITRESLLLRVNGSHAVSLANYADIASPACLAYIEAKGKPLTGLSVSTIVGNIQHIVKLIVQAFTGMRDDEAKSLPYLCIDTVKENGRLHYIVKGRTTKFHHGLVKKSQWITNQQGAQAIIAAQAIADAIYSIFDVYPSDTPKNTDGYPLFVSVKYMGLSPGIPLNPIDNHFVPGDMSHRKLPETCLAILNEEDIRELEYIDPHRAWRSEAKFGTGVRWTFTSHQLRRSLALYAQRSGLVSLPSLRRQLQHLTEEMSRYYARGSAFARNFIGEDKKHFGNEWQTTQPESSGLSYMLNALLTDNVLTGGHADWASRHLKGPENVLLIDRDMTMKRFRKGEMAYRETILGGCTNVGTCDKVAIQWLHIDCIRDNCKNLVCSVPKLERVIAAQRKMVLSLDETTVEYRTEKEDLSTLINVLTKVNPDFLKVEND